MKTSWGMLLLSAWISGGCLTLPTHWMAPKTPPAEPAAAEVTKARAPVTRDQITEVNARELADALLEELDQEAQSEPSAKREKP